MPINKFRTLSIAPLLGLLTLLGCNANPSNGGAKKLPPPRGVFGQRAGGNDGNVGVGGGSTTFYLRTGDWTDGGPGHKNEICAPVADASVVVLDGFAGTYPEPVLNQANWTMQLMVGRTPVMLSAGKDLCGKDSGSGVKVILTGDGVAGRPVRFYEGHLPIRFSNRRIRNLSESGCNQDEDACERVTEVNVDGHSYRCETMNCWIFIGKVPSS